MLLPWESPEATLLFWGSCSLQRSWRPQVTNPPIDPLREGLVMSLEMRLGKRGNLLTPGPESYAQVPPCDTHHRGHCHSSHL